MSETDHPDLANGGLCLTACIGRLDRFWVVYTVHDYWRPSRRMEPITRLTSSMTLASSTAGCSIAELRLRLLEELLSETWVLGRE